MKFQSTKFVTLQSLENNPPKVGQWVSIDGAARGQYLGKTRAGVVVVRYQRDKGFDKIDARNNAALRDFALGRGRRHFV